MLTLGTHYAKANEAAPHFELLVRAALGFGEHELARQTVEKALTMFPNDANLLVTAAKVHCRMRNWAACKRAADAALEAADASWVYFRFVPTPGLMERVHKAGKKGFIAGVTVAGVEPANWKAAAAAGIDGLLTDHPLEWHQASRPPRPKP